MKLTVPETPTRKKPPRPAPAPPNKWLMAAVGLAAIAGGTAVRGSYDEPATTS